MRRWDGAAGGASGAHEANGGHGGQRPILRTASGTRRDGTCWVDEPTGADLRALRRCRPPVLDVGCGPARHTVALAERGIPALGLDITTAMLDVARPRGAPVLERDVFDRVPAAGRWGTVLLLDGNVGIGGDPRALLCRVGQLLRPGGLVLVEVDGANGRRPTTPRPAVARIELGGTSGPWFAWSTPTGNDVRRLVRELPDLAVDETWQDEHREFLQLRRAGAPR